MLTYRPETVLPSGIVLDDSGIRFPVVISYDEWAALAAPIGRMVRLSMWVLGDWLNEGTERFGELAEQAVALTGLDYDTIRNARWVTTKFPLERRRPELSFTHHQEVAGLDPEVADRLLVEALPVLRDGSDAAMSCRDLRSRAREERQIASGFGPRYRYLVGVASQIHTQADHLLGEKPVAALDTLADILKEARDYCRALDEGTW